MARKAHPNPAAPYHTPLRARHESSKQQKDCSFSKKYTSRNLPGIHNSLPFTGADCRLPIQFQKMTSKQATYLHG